MFNQYAENRAERTCILFREYLGPDIPDLHFRKADESRELPTVLSSSEVARVLVHLYGTHRLMVQMMHGCGLRVMEAVRLRVKDIDTVNQAVWVQEAKGGKGRRTLLPPWIAIIQGGISLVG